MGFVFQDFQLIPTLTALENVLVPLELLPRARSLGTSEMQERSERLLARVGLGGRMEHFPSQLSGGEQQRVGLARAFVAEPRILFADEPTGNLDRETGQRVSDLLFELNRDAGTTLVIVTHDMDLAERADRVVHIDAGRLQEAPERNSIRTQRVRG